MMASLTRAGAVLGFALLISACGSNSPDVPSGPTCSVDQLACGQVCKEVLTDPANCGGCGIPCADGERCQGGACSATGIDGGAQSLDGGGGALDGGVGVLDGGEPASAPVVVASAAGDYWNTTGVVTPVASGNADITVDDTKVAQYWEGFGGAFNEMGWNALSVLSPGERDRAIHLLYGADGARFVFGRIPIGASDYAMDRYTLDDVAAGASDPTLAAFSAERDKDKLIPFIKAAQAVRPAIRFWASPWTPPTWMKQGPFSSGKVPSPFDGGSMKDDPATLQAYAQYLLLFVDAYAGQGIPIEAISAQNEPNYTGNYPTCAWTPSIYTKFIGTYLGPAVASANLGRKAPLKIVLGTFNGGGSDRDIVNSVMGDGAAKGYVDVFGFQWGMIDTVGRVKGYHLPIWQSEHKCGNYPWITSYQAGPPAIAAYNPTFAPNDHAYGVESWTYVRDWIRAGVTAYSAWNMVLDTVGVGNDTTRVWPQDALLTVDTAAKTLIVTPTYYVFRHLSQFVASGARVLATNGGDALAFKNPDGSHVVVAFNAGAAKSVTVAVAGKKLQVAMPANGWATVVTP